MTATSAAFSTLRSKLGQPRTPPENLIANQGQLVQMTPADGLVQWEDGVHSTPPAAPTTAPMLTEANLKDCMLWVVRVDDVVMGQELGTFGKTLESGVIKHTNLTGGAPAFSGGELLVIEEKSVIVVNGNSGRYGPRSASELEDVVAAFASSGYGVWSMGYDEDAGRPFPFVGVSPKWVQ